MAKILAFRPVELQRQESADFARDDDGAREGRCAEVILFPGVRYERWNDTADAERETAAAPAKRRRDRQRDILELAE